MADYVSEGGHYYDPLTGKLFGPVAMTTRDGMRPFDLRDARKVGASPSVTTVIATIDKPGLRTWIRNRDIETALRLPTLIGVEDKIQRVKDEADAYVKWSAEFGSQVHLGISLHLQDLAVDPGQVMHGVDEIVRAFKLWYRTSGLVCERSEHSFISELGFAGTIDFLGTFQGDPCIADFKTQDFDDPKDANLYDEHWLQLAGYAVGTEQRHHKRLSVIISRSTPGLVKLHLWPTKDYERHDAAWLSLWEFWQHLKNYYPGGEEWLRTLQTRGKLPQAL